MITVYRFKIFDQRDGCWAVQIGKATKQRIEALGGQIIDGTAEVIDEALINSEGHHEPTAYRGTAK